ncbi:UNKNOWN [Stylonychia lemnae]|uniref:Uncharacterized protein n=1 Tax=Stylonychia lemnae TaxID=5949 RepID=A0A078AQC0_STYLE|nr:UNKNOWN [Stylonychia lemnae]|eukprot:CDW83143.1 UNKNOWN [Stylonychia lemnae]
MSKCAVLSKVKNLINTFKGHYKFANQASIVDTGTQATKGVQFSGQYLRLVEPSNSVKFFPTSNFYFQMYFYICEVDEAHLFCLQQLTSVSQNVPYFCLSTDNDGKLLLQMRLIKTKDTITSQYYPTSEEDYQQTGISLVQGWNWIGARVSYKYGYTNVTIYHSDESQDDDLQFRQVKVDYKWEGQFDQSSYDRAELVLGCRLNSIDLPYIYGSCMKGWIYSIKVNDLTDFIGDDKLSIEHICTTSTDCKMCPQFYSAGCLESTSITNDIIEEWDTKVLSNYPDSILPIKVLDYELTKNSDRKKWPTYISGVGLLSSTESWSYIVQNNDIMTPYFPFPPQFTIEAWIKFDLTNIAPNTTLMNIFGKFTGSNPASISAANRNMKVGFAVANHYMRVYVNSKYYDLDYSFIENYKWQHITISYDLQYAYKTTQASASTLITIYIDGVEQVSQIVDDAVNFRFTGYLILGDGFQGVIRKVRVLNRTPCISRKPVSLAYSKVLCGNVAQDTNDFCDSVEKNYGDCANMSYYYDATKGCLAEETNVIVATLKDISYSTIPKLQLPILSPNLAFVPMALTTIPQLSFAFVYLFINIQLYKACIEGCLVCQDSTTKCYACDDGYFMQQDSSCQQTCPKNYKGNSEHRTCELDITKPVLSSQRGYLLRDYIQEEVQVDLEDIKGCLFGEYWSNVYSQCMVCHDDCVGCKFEDGLTQCLSCLSNKYLNWDDSCQNCRHRKNGMNIDQAGFCQDTCGDGRRYQDNACDDGNTGSGDGCSDECLVESNYVCRAGFFGSRDVCTLIPNTVYNITVTENNDLILEFNRPIMPLNRTISELDFDIQLISRDGQYKQLDFKVLSTVYPTNYLYFYIKTDQTIKASAYFDNMIKVKYLNTGNIVDIDQNQQTIISNIQGRGLSTINKEIKSNLTIKAYLYPLPYLDQSSQTEVEFYNKIMMIFIAGSIALQITITAFIKQTIMPSVIIIFYCYFQFEFPQVFRIHQTNYLLDLKQIKKYQYNTNLYKNTGYEYNSFYVNAQSKIMIIMIILGSVMIATIVEIMLESYSKWRNKYLTAFVQKCYWSYLIGVFIIFFYPLILTVQLELIEKQFDGSQELLSYSLAGLACISLALFFILICIIIGINTKNKQFNESKVIFDIVLRPFKRGGMIYTSFWIIQMIKITVLTFLQSMVQEYATGPISIQTVVCASVLACLIIVRPFKSNLTNLISIVLEANLVIVQYHSLDFKQAGDTEVKRDSGQVIIYTCLTSACLTALLLIIFNIKKISDTFYKQEHGVVKSQDPIYKLGLKKKINKKTPLTKKGLINQTSKTVNQQNYKYDSLAVNQLNSTIALKSQHLDESTINHKNMSKFENYSVKRKKSHDDLNLSFEDVFKSEGEVKPDMNFTKSERDNTPLGLRGNSSSLKQLYAKYNGDFNKFD